jgi:hypothetical protein
LPKMSLRSGLSDSCGRLSRNRPHHAAAQLVRRSLSEMTGAGTCGDGVASEAFLPPTKCVSDCPNARIGIRPRVVLCRSALSFCASARRSEVDAVSAGEPFPGLRVCSEVTREPVSGRRPAPARPARSHASSAGTR